VQSVLNQCVCASGKDAQHKLLWIIITKLESFVVYFITVAIVVLDFSKNLQLSCEMLQATWRHNEPVLYAERRFNFRPSGDSDAKRLACGPVVGLYLGFRRSRLLHAGQVRTAAVA
jgi:hypothetical protein